MSVVSLIKIDLTNRSDIFLFSSYEPTKKLHMSLLDLNEHKAFSGCATDIDLRLQAATIHMVFDDFLSLTTKALTQKEHDGGKFLYSVEQNCEDFLFKWKSIDQEETIISIGSMKVREIDFRSVVSEVFLVLSKQLLNLSMKVLNMEKEIGVIQKEKENSLQLLNDITDMKERVEKELYSKFILVLNEKKQKIKDLKRKYRDSSPSYVDRKKIMTVKSKKVHQISDSSDEELHDHGNMDIAGPSTSKCNNSILFFDDEPALSVSPSKRRNRNQNTVINNPSFQEFESSQESFIARESESEDELLHKL